MLRDLLTALPGYATWPCDEINYIWRHGNRGWPDDCLPVECATPKVAAYIQRRFDAIHRATGCHTVVEKTCANTMRVPFVAACLPENALFLEIVRDGRDVACSALKRWKAPLEPRYLARKVRYVPLSDLPYYGARYLGARLHRLVSSERRVSSWGPRYPGMQNDLEELSLPEACARQWAESVLRCRDALTPIPAARRLTLRYEDFVHAPVAAMLQVGTFLGEAWSEEQLRSICGSVRPSSVGGWQDQLEPELAAKIYARNAEALDWVAQPWPEQAPEAALIQP